VNLALLIEGGASIRKRETGKLANDNPAKVDNDGQARGESLARLAALALANPPEAKAEGVDLTALFTEACQGVLGIDAASKAGNDENTSEVEI